MRQVVREIQLELFQVEVTLFEFENKRKELKAKLARMGAGLKRCTKCQEEMQTEQFYRDRHTPDRLTKWCRECLSRAEKERRRRRAA